MQTTTTTKPTVNPFTNTIIPAMDVEAIKGAIETIKGTAKVLGVLRTTRREGLRQPMDETLRAAIVVEYDEITRKLEDADFAIYALRRVIGDPAQPLIYTYEDKLSRRGLEAQA